MSTRSQPTQTDRSTGRRELNMSISQASSESQLGEQSYRHLFKHLPICLVVAELTATPVIILDVNQRTEMVYGYTAAQVIGNPALCLIAAESQTNLQNLLEQVKQGETVTAEVTGRH